MANNRPRRSVETTQSTFRTINPVDSLAKWINGKVEIEEKLSSGVVKKILWVMFLILIYIYFQHNFESLIRKLNKTEKQVNAHRAAFISHKARYMFASKQSEVEKKLVNSGFEVDAVPPIKMEISPEN